MKSISSGTVRLFQLDIPDFANVSVLRKLSIAYLLV